MFFSVTFENISSVLLFSLLSYLDQYHPENATPATNEEPAGATQLPPDYQQHFLKSTSHFHFNLSCRNQPGSNQPACLKTFHAVRTPTLYHPGGQ